MFEKIIYKKTITILNKMLRKKDVKRLGSNYGGWSFYETKNLLGGNVISAGVGEDVSFDVELIEKFSCRVFLVDPTPRARGRGIRRGQEASSAAIADRKVDVALGQDGNARPGQNRAFGIRHFTNLVHQHGSGFECPGRAVTRAGGVARIRQTGSLGL